MTENNVVLQRIKDFEDRYLMQFQISFGMCKKLSIQRKRLQKIINNEIEPTKLECRIFERFLKLPKKDRTTAKKWH